MSASAAGNTAARAWLLYAAAVASSLAALPLYFVGEEGILAVAAIEMWHRGDWIRHWIYGVDGQHGTFALWLVIPLASVVGWEHVLQATRSVMIAATAGSGAMLYLLADRLWRDRALAALAAAVYVTFADVALYRGWLGYRDPLLGFLAFSSIATVWLAVRERRVAWLAASVLFVTLAFLTKGLIAYVFAGTAAFALLLRRDGRSFLLRPVPIALGVLALALAWAWFRWVLGGSGQGTRMSAEIVAKLMPETLGAYAVKLVAYPVEVALKLLPASALVAWFLARRPDARSSLTADPLLREGALIAGLCILPYWLAPHSHIRYLAPVLPLLALGAALALRAAGERATAVSLQWFWGVVAVKLVVLLAVFPVYQDRYRGAGYAAVAREIVAKTAGHPLYVTDASASGLSVAAHIAILRLPGPPLTLPPARWDSGFVVVREPDPAVGKIAARYRLGGDDLYLLCRGDACAP